MYGYLCVTLNHVPNVCFACDTRNKLRIIHTSRGMVSSELRTMVPYYITRLRGTVSPIDYRSYCTFNF